MNQTRFIIIATFDKVITEEIENIRSALNLNYGCNWALKYPTHITLRTGIIIPENNIDRVIKEFGKIAENQKQININLLPAKCGYSKYEGENKFFVYFPVEKSHELLQLHKNLLAYKDFIKDKQKNYSPHVTLLWDNIADNHTREIKQYVSEKDYFQKQRSIILNNVSFFYQHIDQWKLHTRFDLPQKERL